MHQEWIDEGLILKVGRFREIDCWVRFFSPNQGLVTAMAFGGAKSRRRFCGCLDALNSVLFKVRFFPAKGRHVLEEGTLLRGFPRLRQDAARTGLAANCLQFVQALRISPEDAPAIHKLLMETLDALDQAENVSSVFTQLFRAKICFTQGYAPELDSCMICGRLVAEEPRSGDQGLRSADGHAVDRFGCKMGRFSGLTLAMETGGVYCAHCPPVAGHQVHIGPETRSILSQLASSGPRHWADMSISRTTRGELFQMVDGYVRRHLGLCWRNGRFVAG
ncbi:DNA repair protein RecO [Desulfonatronum thioautotrophicum]|uniref:DNA repair protein RecO n=1 Tax=Desulfonatronum thioautotrophicum TaxID=617001 RepID=UPI0005EB5A24|nr:DNA repair protein RecO [Desulfonatronum thioautotrophicum]